MERTEGFHASEPSQLEELDVTTLVNKEALDKIKTSIGRLQGRQRLPDLPLILPSAADFAIPAIASRVASQRYSGVEPIKLSAGDIKNHFIGVTITSLLLGLISKRLKGRFEGYVERKATERIETETKRVVRFIEGLKHIENPKEQFLKELSDCYFDLTDPELKETNEGEKWRSILTVFNNFALRRSSDEAKEKMPLSTVLLSTAGRPIYLDSSKLALASPEILGAIATFLRSHGQEVPQANPKPPPLMWGIGQLFAGEKLQLLRRELPNMLESFYELLPVNGPAASDILYQYAKKIVDARARGVNERKITHSMVQNIRF